MATTILPPPSSDAGSTWNAAWKAYQANPNDPAAYKTYYDFLAQGKKSGPILAAGNYPAPGSSGAPGGTGTGGTGGPPGATTTVPGTNSPTPTGVLFTQPGGDPYGAAARFGGGALKPYSYDLYTGGQTGFPGAGTTPAPATPSAAPVAPVPAPAPVSAPPSTPGSGGGAAQPGGGYGGQSAAGNEGGAQRGGLLDFDRGNDGSWSDSGGNGPAGNPTPSASQAGGRPPGSFSSIGAGSVNDYIEMGYPMQVAIALASQAPYGIGAAVSAVNAGLHGYNVMNTNALRDKLGIPGTDFLEAAGGVLGLNRTGSFSNPQIASKEQVQAAGNPWAQAGISPEGYNDPGWIARLFGDKPATEYTVDEFGDRQTAQKYGAGNAGGALGLGAVRNPGSSGASMTTGAAGVRGIGAGNLAPAGYSVFTGSVKDLPGGWITQNGVTYAPSGGGGGNGGFAQSGSDRSALGPGTGANPGGGTLAAGERGTGGLASGFGGGGYAKGGYVRSKVGPEGPRAERKSILFPDDNYGDGWTATYGDESDTPGEPKRRRPGYDQRSNFEAGGRIPGRRDRIPDNRRIRANEGEFVVRNSAASAAGPALLGLINTPSGARRVRAVLGL